LLLGDGLGALPRDASFDLLVSNPPYIPREEIRTLQPEVRDHDPHLALDGGPDGLDFYRHLASQGQARLANDGVMILEIGDGQAESVTDILRVEKWIVGLPLQDYSGRQRCLVARKPELG
jgi:release factor glutamine methyltransferase